ncbi:MAG: GGDEF domain-containing protein [Ruminococcaceae bacterium]|nr:GGDEF domain-containing protein [Oscillospiraceae bacterium]
MEKPTGRDVPAREKKGASAKAVILAAAVFILALHGVIIYNTLRINALGAQISEATRDSFRYSQVSWNFENATEEVSDQVLLFVNTGSEDRLTAYLQQADALREQDAALAAPMRSSEYRANGEIRAAAKAMDQRTDMEWYAARLCMEAFGTEPEKYPELASVVLKAEDLALTPEEQQVRAIRMLSGSEYMQVKSEMHTHITNAVQMISEDNAAEIQQLTATLGRYRAMQWVMTISIISILMIMCTLLFLLLIVPLEKSVSLIQNGEPLPAGKGFSDFRRLAKSYNELLHHRKMMEGYLRRQSLTDALTKMSNRLAFQDYASHLIWERSHSSVTLFSLDVNGLKETNDRNGHACGDELLRECAVCIRDAFGGNEDRRCFRFGGDEFAAIWVDVPAEEVDAAMEAFRKLQTAHNVSISVGFAHTDDLSETTMEELFDEADRFMYKEKAAFYEKENARHAVS